MDRVLYWNVRGLNNIKKQNDVRQYIHKTVVGVVGLLEAKSSGNYFTWNNKQQGNSRVFSKLDRMLANQAWMNIFTSAEVSFHNEGEFDHSLALLTIYPMDFGGKKPFKYFTMWKTSAKFKDIVRNAWSLDIQRTKMFKLMKKLKVNKDGLNKLSKKDS
ncbi:uncharacterized protein LOC104884164 [Beta vulgaris subsp. vulgaris]|uniref:uncharacterized protein LOC104884164 n=1 Tax=Beta vulgaris subsp. vulgaris TaxID=3555 RepID=UPI00053FFEFF|nr:uncharacterized protein LOC104884164 [Beta vulgaris subsp. vulgaris]